MDNKYLKIYSKFEAMMLQDADAAITECGLWEWMSTYNPPDGKGFMFSSHPNLDKINAAMKFDGHSGASYGWTMRVMQTIARVGWDKFATIAATENPPCACRQKAGYWSGWCGDCAYRQTAGRKQ